MKFVYEISKLKNNTQTNNQINPVKCNCQTQVWPIIINEQLSNYLRWYFAILFSFSICCLVFSKSFLNDKLKIIYGRS